MLRLFKKSADNKVVVAEPPVITKGKTQNQLVEEIHENFYTEVDRLLASAKISNSLETDKQDLIDKCARLKSLGFKNTKEVKEAEVEIARLDALKAENEAKKTLIEAINYFSFKYPNYKFITEDSVNKICAKYNLVYGDISKYIGEVPDKNLKHIEDFKIDEDDFCYEYSEDYFSGWGGRQNMIHEFMSKEKAKRYSQDEIRFMSSQVRVSLVECGLKIAAPLKDFNMTKSEVKDFKISKIEIPDPVVLKPVFFGGQKHYLIVTAWGLEASDELVVNQKMN